MRTDSSLHTFFEPRGIAVIGAAEGNERPGGRALFNLPFFGYPGAVYPVSRSKDTLHGYRCYSSIMDVPDPVDLAVICVGTERVAEALRECGDRGIPSAVIFAAGFGNGPDGDRLQAQLAAAQHESGVRVIGPNTIGIRAVPQRTWATFAHDIEGGVTPGSVAMIAQSGGLGVYFGSAYLRRRGVGTRYLIDTGNELDVDAAEALEYVAQDPEVSCVGLILEGCRDGRRLMRAVSTAVRAGKPVVFLKAGRSESAAAQVASHTGAIAGSAALFTAALTSAGATVVEDEMDLVDALTIHAAGKPPRGRRLGVVTPSGGYAILTIDAAERYGMQLPAPVEPPDPQTAAHLASGELSNPFDYTSLSAAGEHTLESGLTWMLGQPDVDAVLLWTAHALLTEKLQKAVEPVLRRVLAATGKPLFGCGLTTADFESQLCEMGVLWFEEPTRLVRALSLVTPPLEPEEPTIRPVMAHADVVVGESARALLGGIEHVFTVVVDDADAAQKLCVKWGSLILKVEHPSFPHKTEFGLVAEVLAPDEVPAAYARLLAARKACRADDAPIVAQPRESGVELALGGFLDPAFGPAVMVATGGVHLEVLRDAAVAAAPIDSAHARRLILSLRGAPLLFGARGRPRADIAAAVAALVALSEFMAGSDGRWQSVDVNPLIVRDDGDGAVAVDALLVPTAFATTAKGTTDVSA